MKTMTERCVEHRCAKRFTRTKEKQEKKKKKKSDDDDNEQVRHRLLKKVNIVREDINAHQDRQLRANDDATNERTMSNVSRLALSKTTKIQLEDACECLFELLIGQCIAKWIDR
jgi:hypothetical protein